MTQQFRPAWVEIDLDAVRRNIRAIGDVVAPAEVMAVVKADAYGHGAVEVARAALDAGARSLGVALVEEGVALRAHGIDAPVLVLAEPPAEAATTVVEADLTPIVYTHAGIAHLAQAVTTVGRTEPLAVHLKVDTGMHRVGCAPDDAPGLVDEIAGHSELVLAGVCTHLAVADEPDNPYTDDQLDRFDALLRALAASGRDLGLRHAANSAGALAFERARYDLVRAGIAMYGIAPSAALAGHATLQPAMALKARVTLVKTLPAGARLSYGLRHTLTETAHVATVPLGYADGVPRNLGHVGGEVLVGGRRAPIAGTVTMDQLMVDVGDASVAVGDEVVLIGSQGDETVTAVEWARRLDTVPYEIVSNIGPRVPRRYS
ncbi:MAG TPA: alanine racemase [Acidimicrobiia bacterium]|nr:alanine racemase [Acidimicrobiia bacterium]